MKHARLALSEHWSVIVDAECANSGSEVQGVLFVGGRYHASGRVSATMRVGYRYVCIGASFF